MNARAWLVRLYPRYWRERYGGEFEALLEECLHTPLDILDVALGALDAHLGALYEANWRVMNMVNKLRTTVLIVFTAYIAFIIAGLGLVGLVDDSPAADLMKAHNAGLSSAWKIIAGASGVALLAVVAGGLPLAIRLIRLAFTSSRRSLHLLLVPVYALLALGLYVLFMASTSFGWVHIPGVVQIVSPDNFPTANKLMLGGLMLLFVLGAIASTLAVWKAVLGLEDQPDPQNAGGPIGSTKMYQYAFWLAGVASLAMLAMLIGTLVFGWLANAALPEWFASNMGLLLANTSATYGIIVTLMVLATSASLYGMARGFSARKTA